MNGELKRICYLLWDTFALFALVFTVALLLRLHSALIVAAEFVTVFLFLTHRIANWTNREQEREISGKAVFRTAFRHCLRGFAVLVLLFWFAALLIAAFR